MLYSKACVSGSVRIPTIVIVAFVLLEFSLPFYAHAAAEHFENLTTREGVTVPSWVISPEKVQASVILFSGGGGRLKIDEDGITKTGNFLIRSRYYFVEQGLVTFIPDVPSDQGELINIRISQDHIDDVKKMIQWLRAHYPGKPVWLVGTSRGTISVASVAANTNAKTGADGIVMTATVTRQSNSGKDSVYSTDIDNITVPTLLVHHEDDECYVTPFEDIPDLMSDLKRVKVKQIKSYTGGKNKGHECRGKSYHGFKGIEEDVVNDISEWIKAH